MDEIEWWEFESPAELAEQAAGDIGFVIESAIEAHKGARIALPGGKAAEPVYAALAKPRRIDWSSVTLIPTDDRLVPLDDPSEQLSPARATGSRPRAPKSSRWSMNPRSSDYREAGRLADARLALLRLAARPGLPRHRRRRPCRRHLSRSRSRPRPDRPARAPRRRGSSRSRARGRCRRPGHPDRGRLVRRPGR